MILCSAMLHALIIHGSYGNPEEKGYKKSEILLQDI